MPGPTPPLPPAAPGRARSAHPGTAESSLAPYLLLAALAPACVLTSRGGETTVQSTVTEPPAARGARVLGEFRRVLVEGIVDVEIRAGAARQSVEVHGDVARLAEVTTDVRDATLAIARVPGSPWRRNPRVAIDVPALDGVIAAGSGWIAVSGLDAERFEVELRGGGDLLLRGRVGTLAVSGAGTGVLDASALEAGAVEGGLTGPGVLRRAR